MKDKAGLCSLSQPDPPAGAGATIFTPGIDTSGCPGTASVCFLGHSSGIKCTFLKK